MRYIMGIDQGGSKTHAVITDDQGQILGIGKGKGACHASVGIEAAMDAAEEAAKAALAESGLAITQIEVIGTGLTGIDWPHEGPMLERALRDRFGTKRITAVNDAIIAMRSETDQSNSAVICAGSGLNVAVRRGRETFTYGYYIPDEHQGGGALGRKTVQAVLDAHMGFLPETALTAAVLRHFGVKDADGLLYRRAMEGIGGEEYLQLPPLLERAALDGDAVAEGIWRDYGGILAGYVTARMEIMGMRRQETDVILSGSVLKCRVPALHQAIREGILLYAPGAVIKEAVFEPVTGACLLGLDECYEYRIPDRVYVTFRNTAAARGLTRLPESE